jgi:hypothetical protein
MTHGFEKMPLEVPKDPKVTSVLARRLAMVCSDYQRGEVIVAALHLAVMAARPDHLGTLADSMEEVVKAIRKDGEIT